MNSLINEFAKKYYGLYAKEGVPEGGLEEGFAGKCFDLGFTMDQGESFIKNYGQEVFEDYKSLNGLIER